MTTSARSAPPGTVCCFLCHRYQQPEKMDGTRCADRDGCQRATARDARPSPEAAEVDADGDRRVIDRAKTAKAWRKRARELYETADRLRAGGDHDRADEFERAAAAYIVDADKLTASARRAE